MRGFQDVVDAVGGVDVNNDMEFTYEKSIMLREKFI